MMFGFLNPRRKTLARPFPPEWLATLERNVFLYRLLPEPERARLRDAVKVFVAEKHFEGCAGFAVTDEARVTVAGQACLLVLGFDGYFLDQVSSVLIYPGSYLACNEPDQRRAEPGAARVRPQARRAGRCGARRPARDRRGPGAAVGEDHRRGVPATPDRRRAQPPDAAPPVRRDR